MNIDVRNFRVVSRKEVVQAALRNPDLALLEASCSEEFDEKHLPGARRICYWHGPQHVAEMVTSPASEVIVYCEDATSHNAERAAEHLIEMGYEKIAIYLGGKLDWERGGLAFERSAPFPTEFRNELRHLRQIVGVLVGE